MAAARGIFSGFARWLRAPKSRPKAPRNARLRGLPFLPVVPAIIVVVGVATAAAITRLGVEQLREQSDRATALQSKTLALTLGERLRATPHRALTSVISGVSAPDNLGQRMQTEPDRLFDRVVTTAADRSGASHVVSRSQVPLPYFGSLQVGSGSDTQPMSQHDSTHARR